MNGWMDMMMIIRLTNRVLYGQDNSRRFNSIYAIKCIPFYIYLDYHVIIVLFIIFNYKKKKKEEEERRRRKKKKKEEEAKEERRRR
jgi:hypothetical protein